MNTDTGKIRYLKDNEQPKPNEIPVNEPRSDCTRCKGNGSIPIGESNRAERRRAQKKGLPVTAEYMPCPDCNPD